MKSPRIALIHATPVAIDPIVAAFKRFWPAACTTNLLEDSLSADLARDGELTDCMIERFVTLAGERGTKLLQTLESALDRCRR